MEKENKTSLVETTIQVRGYSYDLKDWVYGSLVPYTNNEPVILSESEDHKSVTIHKVVPDTVTNYTGYKDMNGKDIYVADALRIEHMGVYYVYSSSDGKMEIAPLNYRHEGIQFKDVKKFTLDLSKADNKLNIEIIGNTLLQTLAVALADYVDKYRKEEKIVVTEVKPELIPEDVKDTSTGNLIDNSDEYDYLEGEDYEDYDNEYIDDYDDVDWNDIENWELVLDEREDEIRHQDNKDFVDNPNVGFIKPELDNSVPQFRALSTDLQTWVYGNLLHQDYDFNKSLFIYDRDGKSINIHDILVDTVSRATPYKDMAGDTIYTKDIVMANGDTFIVIEYVPGIGFAVMHLDEYATEKSNDPSFWGHIVHDTWIAYPQVLKVVGNTINGIMQEWMDKIHDAIDAGYKFTGWTDEDLTKEDRKAEDDDPKLKDPLYLMAKQIDAVTYAVDTKVEGIYVDDYLSNNNDIIMVCYWYLPNGYQIHAYYNTATNENAVYYGKWELGPKYIRDHSLISYSANEFSDMIDNVTNLILINEGQSKIIKAGIFDRPNQTYKPKYAKNIFPDDIKRRLFKNKDDISHKEFEEGMKRSFYSYNLYRSVMYRAMTSVGRWVWGYLDEEDPNYIWAIYDNFEKREKGKKNWKWTKMHYITGSLCSNTYLVSNDFEYIYSGDIVDYEGKGRYVIYHTSDIDPSDILNPVSNETGQKFIYAIEYDVLKEVLLRKNIPNKDDTPNEVIASVTAGFKWKPINISEWLRNWEKLTVVGNITESIILDKSVCYNTEDFYHDKDPLPVMFDKKQLEVVSPIANKNYWKKFYDDTADVEGEVSELLEIILDVAVIEPEYDWQIFHNSVTGKIVKAIYLNVGNSTIRLMWQDNEDPKVNDKRIATLMVGTYENYVTTLSLFKYGVGLEEAFNDVVDIMVGALSDITLKYNFEFTMPDLKETKKYDTLQKKVTDGKLLFAETPEYIDYITKHIFNGNIDKRRAVECRALNEYGRWVIGKFNGKTILENGDAKKETSYLVETLGLNTYVLDASGRYIYDHDIICVHNECANTITIVEHGGFMVFMYDFFDKLKEDNIVKVPLYRVLYKQWKDGYMADDFTNIPFVPFTYDWFIRNRERILVLSDTFTSNIEIDDVNI